MIDINVNTDFRMDGWPRSLILISRLGDADGRVSHIEMPIDCPESPASWESMAGKFEVLAKAIRRDLTPAGKAEAGPADDTKGEILLFSNLGELRALLGAVAHLPDDASVRTIEANPGFVMLRVVLDEHPVVSRATH